MIRATLSTLTVALAIACTETGGAPPPDPYLPQTVPEMDPGTDETCPGPTAIDGAVVAMPWRGDVETFIPPTFMGDALAIDYDVRPTPRIATVEVDFDFDSMVDVAPWTLTQECPDTISLGELTSRAGDGALARATIEAHASDGTVRRGRVTFSTGHSAVTLRTSGLDFGSSTEPWWVVYEPASGARRIMILPATTGRETVRVTGLPDDAGTLALVRSTAPSIDGMGVVHAPNGFVGSWRINASAWYARSFVAPPTVDLLGLDAFMRATGDTDVRMLVSDQHFTGSTGDALVRAFGTEGSATLFWPCDADRVHVAVEGLADLSFALNGSTAMSTASAPVDIPIACAAGDTEAAVSVSYSAYNNRGISLALSWGIRS